jgi:hypothetical protein
MEESTRMDDLTRPHYRPADVDVDGGCRRIFCTRHYVISAT